MEKKPLKRYKYMNNQTRKKINLSSIVAIIGTGWGKIVTYLF